MKPGVRLGGMVIVKSKRTNFEVADGFEGRLMFVVEKRGKVWGKVESPDGEYSVTLPVSLLWPKEEGV